MPASKLMRDRDQKATALKRATEDAQAEVEQEEGKIMQELGQRMMQVVGEVCQRQRLRHHHRRQLAADPGPVGRQRHRYHQGDRRPVR